METSKMKTFWQRPEGKMGLLFLLPILALLVWGGVTLLPFVLLALQNTIYTIVLGFVVLVMAIVLLDPKFWSRMGALYTIAMRWFTSFIVELDPIAIIKGYLETLGESLLKMDDQLNLLKGQESKLGTKIQRNNMEVAKLLDRATKAKNLMDQTDPSSTKFLEYKGVVALDSNQASRLRGSNERLSEVFSKILNLRKILEKMRAKADYVLKDMTLEVAVKEDEFNAVQTGHSAFKKAMKVLQGGGLEKELYDESMEFMATDLGNKIGEIERFMENSGSFLTSMDIDNEMFAEKGLAMIDEWAEKGDTLFITSPKETLRLDQRNTIPVSDASFAHKTTVKSKYIK
jgi:hypothetical protein